MQVDLFQPSYCHWVHSIELGTFIPPQMSWEIQPNVTDIFNDQPFVCGANSNMKIQKKSLLVSIRSEKELVKILDYLLILDYGMDEGPQQKTKRIFVYIQNLYTWKFDISNLEFICIVQRWSKLTDQMMNVLTLSLNAIFEACVWLGCCLNY